MNCEFTSQTCFAAHAFSRSSRGGQTRHEGVAEIEPNDPFESDEEEETDESGGGLWGSITHHCPSLAEISFSDFVSLDNNAVTECQPTDQEATWEALEAVQSMDLGNHEEEDPDNVLLKLLKQWEC